MFLRENFVEIEESWGFSFDVIKDCRKEGSLNEIEVFEGFLGDFAWFKGKEPRDKIVGHRL